MAWSYRKTKKIGPFRITGSKSGITLGTKAGPVSVSRSTSGRETKTFSFKGLLWRRSRKR